MRRVRVEAVDNGLVYLEGREEPLQLVVDGSGALRAVPLPRDEGLTDQHPESRPSPSPVDQQPAATFGDILRRAAARGVDQG